MWDATAGMARKFRLTAEGERRLEQERAAIVRSLGEVMTDRDPQDIATFAAYLKRLDIDASA